MREGNALHIDARPRKPPPTRQGGAPSPCAPARRVSAAEMGHRPAAEHYPVQTGLSGAGESTTALCATRGRGCGTSLPSRRRRRTFGAGEAVLARERELYCAAVGRLSRRTLASLRLLHIVVRGLWMARQLRDLLQSVSASPALSKLHLERAPPQWRLWWTGRRPPLQQAMILLPGLPQLTQRMRKQPEQARTSAQLRAFLTASFSNASRSSWPSTGWSIPPTTGSL